jgi:RNA polymerase sigma factor (sigma-70 family)
LVFSLLDAVNDTKKFAMTTQEKPHEIAERLLARYKSGYKPAINELIELCAGLLFHRLRPFLARGLEEEDLWQIARIAVWKAADKNDASRGATFFSYLNFYVSQTAVRFAQHQLRSATRLGLVRDAMADDSAFATSDSDPEREAFVRELRRLLDAGLPDTISARERDALLRTLEGQEQRDIAAVQGVSHTTVCNDLKRATQRLQEQLR